MSFLLSDYLFELPPELIAQAPLPSRDQSRLLTMSRQTGERTHRQFSDLPSLLQPGDLIVVNNSRVIPARLVGRRVLSAPGAPQELGGKIEFLLLEELEDRVWEGAFHAAAKHKPGVRFKIETPDGQGLYGELIRGASESPSGTVVARFDRDPVTSGGGEIPLPHYIERSPDAGDLDRYQTVYAQVPGSAAAPTAGLHFTPAVREALKARGVEWGEVTLHVGLGTFRPVKVEDIRDHVMHEERFTISAELAHAVESALESGRRVIAVGTTTVRALESAFDPETRRVRSGLQRTRLFLHPGGQGPQLVSGLVTNFHLPGSTLMMLVSSFSSRERVLAAYQEAIQKRYRFFSYGDAMLML